MENTAIIKINPEADADIQAMRISGAKLKEYAESQVINSVEDIRRATNDLSVIANLKKALEQRRKEYVTPLQNNVKTINDTFKSIVMPIEEADRITRQKILAYNAEEQRKRLEQENINRLRQEAADREATLTATPAAPVPTIELAPEVPKTVDADLGSTGQRMIRKWRLADKTLVPEEYKILDEATITKVVKAGIPSIPGIEIYEEPTLVVRAR